MEKKSKQFRPISKAGMMSMLMTMAAMLVIVSIIGVARFSLKVGGISVEKDSAQTVTINDRTGLNEGEIKILKNLAVSMRLTEARMNVKGNRDTFSLYYGYLEKHYRSTEFQMDNETAVQMNELIDDMNELILLEKQYRISDMTLDGREVAVHILGRIYELSGLELVIDNEGNIEQISDLADSVLYRNTQQEPTDFRYDTLILIVTVVLVMISICFNIARRNRLFEKGGEFGGIKEKRIA